MSSGDPKTPQDNKRSAAVIQMLLQQTVGSWLIGVAAVKGQWHLVLLGTGLFVNLVLPIDEEMLTAARLEVETGRVPDSVIEAARQLHVYLESEMAQVAGPEPTVVPLEAVALAGARHVGNLTKALKSVHRLATAMADAYESGNWLVGAADVQGTWRVVFLDTMAFTTMVMAIDEDKSKAYGAAIRQADRGESQENTVNVGLRYLADIGTGLGTGLLRGNGQGPAVLPLELLVTQAGKRYNTLEETLSHLDAQARSFANLEERKSLESYLEQLLSK